MRRFFRRRGSEYAGERTVRLSELEARVAQAALCWIRMQGLAADVFGCQWLLADAVMLRLTEALDGDEDYYKDFRAVFTAAVDQADAALADPTSGVSDR